MSQETHTSALTLARHPLRAANRILSPRSRAVRSTEPARAVPGIRNPRSGADDCGKLGSGARDRAGAVSSTSAHWSVHKREGLTAHFPVAVLQPVGLQRLIGSVHERAGR